MSIKPGLPVYALFAVLCILCPQNARAERLKSIDEQAIRAFLETMTDITNNNHDMNPLDLHSYLDDHLSAKGRFTSQVTYDIPGMPAQEKELTLTKNQFIDTLTTEQDNMQNYEAHANLDSFKIARGGREAVIETSSSGSGLLQLGRNGNPDDSVPVTGSSRCTQKLGLSGKGMIELRAAHCETAIRFDPFHGESLEDSSLF
ncbi:MAG: hypothetical protein H6868_04365 [Rhodospirillales bacterium]|nr:hypothetical protein [Rhodospirillales bacterium]